MHDRARSNRLDRRPNLEALEDRRLMASDLVAGPIAEPAASSTTAASGALADFDSITGASATRSAYQVDGSGSSVAVIDTGINYNHEALGSGFGAGHKVVAGYDFADKDSDPDATTWQHGTAVAGLIASSDPAHLGVAPGADLVALRVFGNDNQGSFDRVADAMQWVIDNHDTYGITVVNLSISDNNNYTNNWFAKDGGIGQRMTELIHSLAALNIPVVTATGNSFSGTAGEGFTAILGETISVTATDSTDHFVANAQRMGGANATDLAAPGQGLTSTIQGNQFTTVDGTSFAAPLVSGAVVLLQQIYKSRFGVLPKLADVESWLKQGSDPINDPITGATIGRLDIPKAAALIPGAPKATPAPAPVTVAPAPVAPTTPAAPATPAKPTAPAAPAKPTTPVQATTPPAQTKPVDVAPPAQSKPAVTKPADTATAPVQVTTPPAKAPVQTTPVQATKPTTQVSTGTDNAAKGSVLGNASQGDIKKGSTDSIWSGLFGQLSGKWSDVKVWKSSASTTEGKQAVPASSETGDAEPEGVIQKVTIAQKGQAGAVALGVAKSQRVAMNRAWSAGFVKGARRR
ncbi:S8 family serine peptidase [Isosphaeraceae bacterium EP7]